MSWPPELPQPVCGWCGHVVGMHDNGEGRCLCRPKLDYPSILCGCERFVPVDVGLEPIETGPLLGR
jgi:hypothetical protein